MLHSAKKLRLKPHRVDILILAAGTGSRFDDKTPKQFAVLDGKTLLHHACLSFAKWQNCASITICYPEKGLSTAHASLFDSIEAEINMPLQRVMGGARRDISVLLGLRHIQKRAETSEGLVMVHDSARPFVPETVLNRLLASFPQDETDLRGVIPVMPVTDTIKSVSEQTVNVTMDRQSLVRVQTPQLFRLSSLLDLHEAHAAIPEKAQPRITDDASLVEQAGGLVLTVKGDSALEKITYAEDILKLSTFESLKREGPDRSLLMPRFATGYDVHKFSNIAPGPIMICGIAVPHEVNVTSHSDGDVGLHALCDAIFGALADGDIGAHFPPIDMRWSNASSDQFLAYACEKAAAAGAEIHHLDVTIICERPKIGPYRDAMRNRIAEICALPMAQISVKATTSEGLGFTGRGEGIAAQASATLMMPTTPATDSQDRDN